MNYIIIRTCPKDDYISRLCYESFRRVGIKGNYRFFAAHGDYKWLPAVGAPYTHMECANFGGQRGAVILMRHLNNVVKCMRPGDKCFVVDADIVLFENIEVTLDLLAPDDWDMAGIFGFGPHTITGGGLPFGMQHISGQLMVFSYWGLKNALRTYPRGVVDEVQRMINTYPGVGIADDTYLSAQVQDNMKFNFAPEKAWQHIKAYHYEGRTDWDNIIDEIKKNAP